MTTAPIEIRTNHEDGSALAYARALLAHCGVYDARPEVSEALDAASEWARSGAMSLTGRAEGTPRLAPGPLALCARGALAALRSLTPASVDLAIDAPALLGERAAIAGHGRRGRIAPGGSCRLLRAHDGWLALNLARDDDEAMLDAWLECERDPCQGPWEWLGRRLVGCDVARLVERGRLMGLAVAPVSPLERAVRPWLRRESLGTPAARDPRHRPLVLDLSSLWAGPLATSLLQHAGADVIKLESRHRPDGARRGPSAFFDLLNAGKRSLAVDLREPQGRQVLRELIHRVDVVVESARPRALRQLGLDARSCVAARPGLTWLSITGYGRREPEANWVAFGDDAAVAAGAAATTGEADERPLFCGDAIADPLTGLHAALAAWAAHRSGGGVVLDVALRSVTAHALAWPAVSHGPDSIVRDEIGGASRFTLRVGDRVEPVAQPRARTARVHAAKIGADTGAVLDELGIRG